MALFEQLFQKNPNNGATFNKPVFVFLRWVIGLSGIFIVLGILFPRAMAVILNTVWMLLIVASIIFFTLGVLVVIGLRREAAKILDILMEGSLTFVDFLAFLKLLWLRFIEMLKEFLLFVTPVLAYIAGFVVYTLLLILYKTVGKTYDITLFTIVLTFALVLAIGILNKPSQKALDLTKWFNKVKKLFRESFIDAFEVILFIFFLTMDSTNLFFLPQELNIPLEARFRDYDLMVRGFVVNEHLMITVNIIVAAIGIEIVRNVIKIVAMAKRHYTQDILLFQGSLIPRRAVRVKSAIRKSFNDAKDDLIRFITFTTVLFGVFLVFPRLKLLTLATASVTALILDIIITDRLFIKKSNDLISRTLSKVFRL